MENYTPYLAQLEQLISSGSSDNIALAMEIAAGMGLYDQLIQPWRDLWNLCYSSFMSDQLILEKLTKSVYLNLIGIELREIPPAVFLMSKLETLDLSHNRITEIPEGITKLASLKSLNLNFNGLSAIPDCIAEMQNLSMLYLSGNQLTNITTLPNSIEVLNISENKFKALPGFLLDKNKISYLDISENEGFVWDLKSIDIHKIAYLFCYGSEIINFDFLQNENLTYIYDENLKISRVFGKWHLNADFYDIRNGMNLKDYNLKTYCYYKSDYYYDDKHTDIYGYSFSDQLEDAFHHNLKRYKSRS